jgi:hypothetical protein
MIFSAFEPLPDARMAIRFNLGWFDLEGENKPILNEYRNIWTLFKNGSFGYALTENSSRCYLSTHERKMKFLAISSTFEPSNFLTFQLFNIEHRMMNFECRIN